MSAGASALREAERADLRVAEYERRLLDERARADAFRVAGRTEAELAARLTAMDGWGWRLLADRRWPGTRSANVDLIHVGPGGVLVIDVKCWAEPDIVDGRLYRGQADAEDELDKLRRVTELVTDLTAAAGLAPTEVVPVLVFMGQHGTNTRLGRVRILDEHSVVPWAVARGPRLSAEQVAQLYHLLDERFPPCEEHTTAVSTVIPEPVLPLGRHEQERADTLFDVGALEAAVLEHALAAPIEEWMTFLHPEQIRLARRTGSGPTRISGAAGTGKTVVALHRAAYLAESLPGPVLVTSFVRTLPPVLANLYRRMSPATADHVEFVGLHAWARGLLAERGQRVRIDTRAAEQAYSRAWSRTGKTSCLSEINVPWTYWREEIDHVIKGRGITDPAEYLTLRRIGRRTRLPAPHREAVWALYVDYEQQLRTAGVHDFNDILGLALAELREHPLETRYAAVIADEVQDLNCQAVRLLAAISGNGERLLVIGDGQQQVYPGGYTLAEAGLSLAGRSTVLRTNYRNAANILAASTRVVADDEFDDLDDGPQRGRREITTVREDGQVWNVVATSLDDLRGRAVAHVAALVMSGRAPGDIAVLVRTNPEADVCIRTLTNAGVAAMRLSDYDGIPTDAVKVGTVQRAKGLEFAHVVVPVHQRAGDDTADDARQERRGLHHRQLFVAMTRARDTLWIGRTA